MEPAVITPVGGLNKRDPVLSLKEGTFFEHTNWFMGINRADSPIYSFLSKFPPVSTYLDCIADMSVRGLYHFKKSTGADFVVMAGSNGKVYYNGAAAWTEIGTGLSGRPVTFHNYKDTLLVSDALNRMKKWNGNNSSIRNLMDKSNPSGLSGTLTFTKNSYTVSGSGTAFDTELEIGQFIKKDSTDGTYWYEVAAIASATSLTLTTAFLEATGAGAAAGSVKSGYAPRGRHLCETMGFPIMGCLQTQDIDQQNTTGTDYLLLDASQTTEDSDFLLGTGTSTVKGVAQSFTTGANTTAIGRIVFKGRRAGGTEGNLICELRTALGSGSVLGSKTIAVSTLGETDADITFNFDASVTVSASTRYYACLRQDTDTTTTSVYIRYNSAGGLASESMYYSLLTSGTWGADYTDSMTINFALTYDTYINSSSATTNYDTSTKLYIKKESDSPCRIALAKASFAMFDPKIPITKGEFCARVSVEDGVGGGEYIVERLLRDWVSNQTTWNIFSTGNNWGTAGAKNSTTDYTTVNLGVGSYWPLNVPALTPADITVIMQGWIAGTLGNYGLRIVLATTTSYTLYIPSKESTSGIPYFRATLAGGGNLASYDLYFKVYAAGEKINHYAQTFQSGAGVTKLSQVDFYAEISGSVTLKLDIMNVDGSSLPDEASIITSITKTFTMGTGWIAFGLDTPTDITAATTYALRVSYLSGAQADLYYAGSGNSYANGSKCYKASATWAAQANQDFLFKTYTITVGGTRQVRIGNGLTQDCNDWNSTRSEYTIDLPLMEGEINTGIAKIPDGFIALGDNSMHFYKYITEFPYFVLMRSIYGKGCNSSKTIRYLENSTGFYFLDDDGPQFFTGGEIQSLDGVAEDARVFTNCRPNDTYYTSFPATMPTAEIWPDRNWCLLSVPKSGAYNSEVYVFDYRFGLWMGPLAKNASDMVLVRKAGEPAQIYFGNSDGDGYVYKLDLTGAMTTAGSLKFVQKSSDLTTPLYIKKIVFLVRLAANTSASFSVNVKAESEATGSTHTVSFVNAGASYITSWEGVTIERSGRIFEIAITDTITTGTVDIIAILIDKELQGEATKE